MSTEIFETSDLERVCELAAKFNLKSYRNNGVEIEFHEGFNQTPANTAETEKKKKTPTDDELLLNPMAGLDNG